MDKKNKILIVEDEKPMVLALKDKFEREGFVVSEASDGVEGLAKAFAEKPDIILLDILMPKMDGLATLKHLRAENDYGKAVPVILLTNLSADKEEIIQTVAETGPAYYIVKSSLTIQEVVDKVRDLLANPAS